ncbi:MAG: YjbQ family protein [Candidatus Sericytochromatia bacterium]
MVVHRSFEIRSSGRPTPQLITGQVERLVRSSGISNGLALVFVPGSGAALLSVDCPGGQLQAAERVIEELHVLSSNPDVCSSLGGTSLSFPVVKHQLVRATWQEILLVDFVPSERWHPISVQLMGE